MPLRALRLATAFAFATQAFLFISLSTRLPDLKEIWEVTNTGLSGLLLMMVLLAGVGSVTAEFVAGHRDSALALRVGLALITLGVPGVLLSESLSLGLPALACYGLGLGMVDAATNMQAVTLEQRYGRPILPSFHGAWTLGAVLGALLTVVSGTWPHESIAFVAVLPALALLAPYLSGDRVLAPSKEASAGLPMRPILLVGIAMALFYMVDVALQTWGATYARDVFDTGRGTAAVGVFGYLVASGIVRMAGDGLVARHGAVLVLQRGAVVGALGLTVIVVAPTWPIAILGCVLTGAGLAVVAPLSFSAAAQLAGSGTEDPEQRRARVDAVIARFNLFNYAGALLGSVLTGLVGGADLRWGFVLPAVLVLALVPLARSFVANVSAPDPIGSASHPSPRRTDQTLG